MAMVTFSVEMDEELKVKFQKTCEWLGISMAAAINLFATAVVNEQRMPFEIGIRPLEREDVLDIFRKARAQALSKNPDGMTLDEINAEILAARTERD